MEVVFEGKVGERIREYRKKKNLSQKQLAEMTGLATITIQGYEAGKYKPKAESLERLAAALECEPQDLRPSVVFHPVGAKMVLEKIAQEVILPDIENIVNDAFEDNIIKEVNEDDLLEAFNQLNAIGKAKVFDYANDLVLIPDYTKKEPDPDDQQTE